MFQFLWRAIKKVGNFLQSPLLLIIRLYWGYELFITGLGKFLHLQNTSDYFASLGIPFPYLNALFAGGIECIGGLLLFLGLFSRLAAIPVLFTLAIAYLTAGYDSLIELFENLNPDPFFHETPFLFAYAALLIFCFGPGKISLDYWLTGDYKQKEMP